MTVYLPDQMKRTTTDSEHSDHSSLTEIWTMRPESHYGAIFAIFGMAVSKTEDLDPLHIFERFKTPTAVIWKN